MRIISRIIDFFFSTTEEQEREWAETVAESEEEITYEDVIEAAENAQPENEGMETFEAALENQEKCSICGKTFVGENAAQKKGGHKASAHSN